MSSSISLLFIRDLLSTISCVVLTQYISLHIRHPSCPSKLIFVGGNDSFGAIVHVGIVFMFVGFTGHAFDKEKEFSLKIGETDHVAGYEFTLLQMSEAERPNHYAWISDIRVTNNKGEYVTNLYPEKRIYFHKNPDVNRRQPHSELDIYSTLNQDIYSIFSAVDNENGVAFLKIMVNPLVRWVWIGGYILVIGTVIAMWPRKD